MKQFQLQVKHKLVTFTLIGNDTEPDFKHVTSVAVVAFTNDGRIVAVDLVKRGIDLPGGHVEPGETSALQTLRREVMEEASMTIQDPILVEAIQSDYFDDRHSYMLIYAAFVDELLEFTENHESIRRVILTKEELLAAYTAGDTAILEHVVDVGWKLLTDANQHQ